MTPHIPILEALEEGAYVVDRDRKVMYWNPAAERITGYTRGDVLGRWCGGGMLDHVDERGRCLCGGECPLAKAMETGCEPRASVFFHHKNGHRAPTTVRGLPLRDGRGQIVGAIQIFTDSAEKADLTQRLAELESLAYLDQLTRLPNRRYVAESLERRLSESRRTGAYLGVAMFDVDHFKQLNDTHGHAAGDEMLRVIGRVLSSVARRSDVIGRWGGEEFVGVFPGLSRGSLREVLERLRVLVAAARLELGDTRVTATISIGGTIALPDDTPATVLQRTDKLLYQSKIAGRNRLTLDAGG